MTLACVNHRCSPRSRKQPFKFRRLFTVLFTDLFTVLFTVLLTVCLPRLAFAEKTTYYNQHAAGWYWYHDPEKPKKAPDVETSSPAESAAETATASTASSSNAAAASAAKPKSATAEMKALHAVIEEAIDRALLNPTQENVNHYLALQHAMLARSDIFSRKWKNALLLYPQYDYALQTPDNQTANAIQRTLDHKTQTALIQHLAKTNGLFFFYKGNCRFCHAFAPILKRFASEYGFTIIPISIGNGFLSDFPNSKMDNGQATALSVERVPALFLVNPKTRRIAPVSFGYMSDQALFDRMVFVGEILAHQKPQTTADQHNTIFEGA